MFRCNKASPSIEAVFFHDLVRYILIFDKVKWVAPGEAMWYHLIVDETYIVP